MKKFICLGLLAFSSLSFAHTCHIALYDQYNRPALNFYSELDDQCQSAAKRCYDSIRANRLHPAAYKCYTISMKPDRVVAQPLPVPRPEPVPRSQPTTITRETLQPATFSSLSDSQRNIEMGETVIFRDREWIVTDLPYAGLYDLKPVGGKDKDIIRNVPRQQIAITRGCHLDICSKDSVIELNATRFVAVIGIVYNGQIITKILDDKKLINYSDAATLARTKGCVKTSWGELCVGNTVQDRSNRYYKLAGIQPDGRVVLEAEDSFRPLSKDINPSSLIPVR